MRLDEVKSKPEIYVLVGLPGSGKSTWTKDFLAKSDKDFVVLSTDDIIEAIAKAKNSTYNQVIMSSRDEADKQMKRNASSALSARKNIIWDQTNLGANKRRKILSQVPKEYYKVAVVFEVDEQELQNRLNKREAETGKRISPKIVSDMREAYIEPSKSEGFDSILKVKG